MKIKSEHYNYMKDRILSDSKAPTLPYYISLGLTEKRWRWDLLYKNIGSRWISDNIYSYADDDHIDTALRKILKNENNE